MATSLWQLLGEYKVVIPILQRDYAQGRQTGKAPKIREKFLNALVKAISEDGTPLELDFVYGYLNEDGGIKNFIPLDGQQRLTTLYLLHWFIAIKEKRWEEAKTILLRFTYQTRHSSKIFCSQLVDFFPDNLNVPLRDSIINQSWFFTAWVNDPTISSMLNMLNEIQIKFKEVRPVWDLLTSDTSPILFHLLPMGKLGLPEDLYIKMNSRGKELTDFEYFKSQFSEILDKELSEVFNNKADQIWSDLFWNLYKEQPASDIAKLVDEGFLRFYRYTTDIIIVKEAIDIGGIEDEIEISKIIYGPSQQSNIEFLFKSLDAFVAMYKSKPDLFNSVFYIDEKDYDTTKVRLFFQRPETDLFKKCADFYGTRLFTLGEQLMLYGCIEHLINNTDDFNRRIRKLRNLIANSEDELRKENMQSLLGSVTELIHNDAVKSETKFNKRQVEEEKTKQKFIGEDTQRIDTIYRIEDHELLQGCAAIFYLDTDIKQYADKFIQVFNGDWDNDLISRALLCFGDYSQKYGSLNRFGNHTNPVWRELFTPSQRRNRFQKTREVLKSLLNKLIQDPESTFDSIIVDYIGSIDSQLNWPRDWRYYFIKYTGFRKNEDGYYYWPVAKKQYECIMMRRSQFNGFNWSPFLYTLKTGVKASLNLENYGAPLLLEKGNAVIEITNCNEGYKLNAIDEEGEKLLVELRKKYYPSLTDLFAIQQNTDGLDIEDRIEKGKELILNIRSL